MENLKDFTDLFKVLSHPVRLAVLAILRNGEQCVCHMEARLGLRQAYISQQLSVLKSAGIIEDRRDGWNIFYRVIKPELYDLLDQAGTFLEEPFSYSASGPQSSVCPCPKCNPPQDSVITPEQVVFKE